MFCLFPVDSSYLAPHMSNLMPGFEPAIDIDQQTDSNHDTALTLAAAGMIRTISKVNLIITFSHPYLLESTNSIIFSVLLHVHVHAHVCFTLSCQFFFPFFQVVMMSL